MVKHCALTKTETVRLTLVVIATPSSVSQCVCASGRVRECSPPEITRKKPRQSSAQTTTVIDMHANARNIHLKLRTYTSYEKV